MKNRVLAVLLAVCMIAGTCVLFASGAGATQTTYAKKGDAFFVDLEGMTYYDVSQLEKAPSGVGTLYKITAKNKSTTISPRVTKIDNSNVRDYLSFSPALNDDIVKVEGYFGPNDTTIEIDFSIRPGVAYRDEYVYTLNKTLEDSKNNSSTGDDDKYNDDSNEKVTSKDYDKVAAFRFTDEKGNTVDFAGTYEMTGVDRSETLHNLSMGLQFYGNNTYTNISASEVAHIKATYKQSYGDGGAQSKDIVTYMNTISDLKEGTKVSLTAELKDPKDSADYGFKCWVDGNNKVISENSTIIWTAGSSPSKLYAVFVELKGRVRINYSWEGEGNVAYQEKSSTDKVLKRSLLTSDEASHSLSKNNVTVTNGQISVMEGHEVTFVFTPKEGFEVAHVYVDRTGSGSKVDVASFKSIILGDGAGASLAALKELISATGANRTFTIESDKHRQEQIYYKFTFTSTDTTGREDLIRSIHVEFKLTEVYKAPEGKPLPTVEPEGVTLATGAAAENAEGANGGAATTLPPEGAAGANGASPRSGSVVNPATGSGSSTGAISVFTAMSLAAAVAFVTMKKRKKED